MAVLDPFMADVRPSGLQRGRGGFLRSADDAPYVSDPSGEIVKGGDRKGEVKRVKYGSPSNAGRLIENDVGLVKYKQRLGLLGIGISDQLREACKALVDMDPDSKEFGTCADLIVVEADKLTRSSLAADRGSHGHMICQLVDEATDPISIIAAGEELGLDRATQAMTALAWLLMLQRNGLEILAVEAACVDDRWRLAGTLDRIVRTTKWLRFVRPDGEIVEIPPGTVLILDIKFGKTRRAHLVQIASYAQSKPYDTELEVRGEWPWPIDQSHALIAHGDFGGNGAPVTIELVWVDLVAGREHGGRCVAEARTWNSRDDLWSVAQIDVPGGGEATTMSVPPPGVTNAPPSAPSGAVTAGKQAGIALEAEPCSPATLSVNELLPRNGMPQHALDELDVDRMNDARRASYKEWTVTPERLAIVDARARPATDPDQGADVDEVTFAATKAHYGQLDPAAKGWIAELIGQAKRRGVSFHARDVRSVRVFELYRALIALAASGNDDDDILRALLAPIVGDVAFFAGVEPGHLVGSLDWRQAGQLARLVDAMNTL